MRPNFDSSKFPLGQVLATPGVIDAVGASDIKRGLWLHSQGEWGDVSEADQAANDQALIDGTRLLSAYQAETGTRFWVITEADRSSTTVLLPDEY